MAEQKDMDRRQFLKVLGGAGIATAAVASGCAGPNDSAAEGFQEGEVPTDQMTYRKNTHGLDASILGYGMMRLPSTNGGPAKEETDEIDQELVNKEVDYAIAHGLTYFDTAPVYCKGRSEHVVGIALSRHKRSEYTIATKMSNMRNNSSRESSIEMYRNSLKELQVDCLDYYLLHSIGGSKGEPGSPDYKDPMALFNMRFIDNGILDFLMAEREAGRIKNLGFSFHGSQEVFDHALSMHDRVHWDFVQIQMNYVDWKHADEISDHNVKAEYLYNELYKRQIPVVIMEPLLGGRLADMPEHIVQELKSREPQRSIASWAFRFCGTHPGVMTVLSGMTYMEHLQDNIRSFAPLKPLNDEELAMLERMAVEYVSYPLVPCTGCEYCMPCPYGLDIPSIFRHYNKCVNEGSVVRDTNGEVDSEYRKARRAFLVGYDRSVPKLRQADHCIGCGKCMEHCPQGIQIPIEMRRINNYAEDLKKSKL